MSDPHTCGHGGVYHADCRSCLVAELAMMPRVVGQRWMRGIKAESGRAYAEALGAEVIAFRERWAARLEEGKAG